MSEAVDFLQTFARALAVVALYPSDHVTRRSALDATYRRLQDLFAVEKRPIFSFLGDEVVMGAIPLRELRDWEWGGRLAGIGMLFGLLVFQYFRGYLQGIGEPPAPADLATSIMPGISKERLIYLVGFIGVIAIWQLIQQTSELGVMLLIAGTLVVAWTVWFSLTRCEPVERDRMIVMLILIALSVMFWALFEQAGSSVTLFTDRNVAMGEVFTAGMFQSLNPLFIVMLAPLFAWLWVRLSSMRLEPSTPAKFGLGFLQVGLGFAVLVFGASLAGPDGKVSIIWLALMYLLHTSGELCLSPVGLSMVTKLSVQRVAAMMMGVWFLSSAFAAYAGGMIAGAMAIEDVGTNANDAVASLAIYMTVFEKLAIVAVILGALLLLVSPALSKRMHGVH